MGIFRKRPSSRCCVRTDTRIFVTPIVEHTQLFTRGIGEVTDIVEKEMYTFTDAMNGENLTMRPEKRRRWCARRSNTTCCTTARSACGTSGPMFRHERPQRGRYRQFHQVGVEAIGFAGPDADAEIIMMCQRLWDDLGLMGIKLEINSLGLAEERAAHRVELIAYLEKHMDVLDEEAKRRLLHEPAAHARYEESGHAGSRAERAQADRLPRRRVARALRRFAEAFSKANNIPFTINPRLVRGLDYYNLTVFEWVTDKLGAQGTVCGRRPLRSADRELGGKPTAACGWAMGVERMLELLKEEQLVPEDEGCDVYVVHQGDAAREQAFIIAERLRDAGLDVILHCSADGQSASFKSQMKRADASGAAFAVVLGEDEIANGTVGVKPLRDTNANGGKNEQQNVPAEDLTEFLINAMVATAEDGDD